MDLFKMLLLVNKVYFSPLSAVLYVSIGEGGK